MMRCLTQQTVSNIFEQMRGTWNFLALLSVWIFLSFSVKAQTPVSPSLAEDYPKEIDRPVMTQIPVPELWEDDLEVLFPNEIMFDWKWAEIRPKLSEEIIKLCCQDWNEWYMPHFCKQHNINRFSGSLKLITIKKNPNKQLAYFVFEPDTPWSWTLR